MGDPNFGTDKDSGETVLRQQKKTVIVCVRRGGARYYVEANENGILDKRLRKILTSPVMRK